VGPVAIISTFERITKQRIGKLTSVDCGYAVVESDDETYLLLETYGSSERALVGKPSQALHLDRSRAAELKKILTDTFPGI
jgi:hypothetical protein